jgi:electron transport complex protein RnfC
MNSLLTFPKGGVHPPECKFQTQGLAIEPMPTPDELELILSQHIGAPCVPTVAKRDLVDEGGLIGEVPKGLVSRSMPRLPGKSRISGCRLTLYGSPPHRSL